MNLDHLRYFRTIAELEHYRKAAEALHITQPTLNYAISQLESELGVSLFEHIGRNVQLTRYGRLFLHSVQSSLDQLDSGIKALKEFGNNGGIVLLGGIQELTTSLIPTLMRDFLKEVKASQVQFEIHSESIFSVELLDTLDKNRIDIAFVSYPGDAQKFECHPFLHNPFVLAVPKAHPLANRNEVALKECEAYPFISFSAHSALHKTAERIFTESGISPRVIYETDEISAIGGLVEAEFGIAVLPNLPILKGLNIVMIPITDADTSRTAYLCRKRLAEYPPAADCFYKFCLERLTELSRGIL